MSLFLNTSSLHNRYSDCCTLDVSETIERDCLSVLHKLHDQVNGLQLVQVVVQPLARLFNPASLAALVANVSSSPSTTGTNLQNAPSSTNTSGNHSHATTPTPQHQTSSGVHHGRDLDGTSTTTSISSTNLGLTSHNSHSRSQSFASAFNTSNNSHNSLMSSASTYMMSPDTAQALIARLDTDRDVNWLMEIIGYGLSMPFSLTGEQDSVKDCCTIYCEWLASALLPYNERNEDSKYQQLSKLVPVPIRKDPNRYARKMLSHLYNVFLPRQSLGTSSNQKDQTDAALTAVSRQAVLCHRVLRTIESIAQNQANLMDNQTWDHLLALLLTVNDKLLSAPTEPDDIGTQLHDRILGVLFDLMILASAKSLPTSSLWKTFHDMCLHWRHRPALVDHWRRVTLQLTRRLVTMPSLMSKSRAENELVDQTVGNPAASVPASAIESAIAAMDYKNLSQTWYRFLDLIGNPVELADPNIISRTDEFYHSACSSDNVLDPRQHPCLNALPQIFINSMFGLRDFIDTFLGTYQQSTDEQNVNDVPHNQSKRGSTASLTNNSPTLAQPIMTSQQPSHQPHPQPQALTPTQSRKSGIKSIAMKSGKVIPFTSSSSGSQSSTLSPSVADSGQASSEHLKSGAASNSSRQQQHFTHSRPSLTSLSSRVSQNQQQPQFKLSVDRPKCNSLLHIFGDWLFSAALIGSDLNQEVSPNNDCSTSEGDTSVGSSTTTEVSDLRSYSPSASSTKRSSNQRSSSSVQQSPPTRQQDSSGTSSNLERITLDPPLTADSFEAGQAEAMGILCKIFSSKTSTEDISPNYLSRFYLCLQHCLAFGSGQDSRYQQSNGNQTCGPIRRQLLSSVLINSTSFLQKDLDGINLLIPCFIKAIEFVFECSEKEMPIQPPPRHHNRSGSIRQGNVSTSNTTNHDLRRACILTLLNLLAYPFHFQDLAIRSCLIDSSPANTFKSLRPRLLKLLFVALQTETDPINMQILFGGLSLTIHDLASNADKMCDSRDDNSMGRIKTNSTSSATSGNDSNNSSLEVSNRQDDTSSQNSFVFNSNGGFLVKSLHVTCHLLINIWKHDTQVSLAALELLTTIARLSTSSSLIEINESSAKSQKMNNNNNRIEMRNEYMQTTKWICDYICNQCSRPPPAHSRDMHSTIVAAYQCLSVWFYNHSYLLADGNCVRNLMEVIELGVSGQKSKTVNINPTTGMTNHSIIYKGDKIMKPSSMRVREAAESLLNLCMVRVTTPANGSCNIVSSYDTVLDELALAELFGGLPHRATIRQVQNTEIRQLEAYKLFKYFSDDNSVIFALLDGLNHDPATKDSVICLLRTAFGKHCWKMKFNYYTEKSREKIIANKALGLIKRPFQQQTKTPDQTTRIFPFPASHIKSIYFNNNAKFFPETLENIPSNDLDHLVTTLDDYIEDSSRDARSKTNIDKLGKMFSQQVLAEQTVMSECASRIKRVDCEEPQPSTDLDAARILINHLGLKTALSSLIDGDKISNSFVNDLKSLDNHSVRTCDTVNIFYVRRNRTSPREILESVRSRHNVSLAFFEWILKLGQPTVVKDHSRWTGKLSTSWNNRQVLHESDIQTSLSRNQMLMSDHGGSIFDGDRMTLHWSDMCQELAFLVPHKIEKVGANPSHSNDHCQTPGCDTNIIIFWLECPDDMLEVPCDAMLSVAENACLIENDDQSSNPPLRSRDYVKYFISPMKNGLYRINLVTSFGRHWLALPLVDNMTVSRGILSGLLRESILNLCRRRRLDADSYQPPHVRRRIKIQELCNSYKISCRYDSTEFYNNLFRCKTT